MSDRYKGFIVALDNDYRDDDAQAIMDAILMIKGVKKVSPSVAGHDDMINRMKIKMEYQEAVIKSLENL